MSMLFGPDSVTTSSVSLLPCAKDDAVVTSTASAVIVTIMALSLFINTSTRARQRCG